MPKMFYYSFSAEEVRVAVVFYDILCKIIFYVITFVYSISCYEVFLP